MSAIGVFLALCSLGVGFMVAFFVALCRDGQCTKSGTLTRVGERRKPFVNAAEPMISAEWGIHLVNGQSASHGPRTTDVA